MFGSEVCYLKKLPARLFSVEHARKRSNMKISQVIWRILEEHREDED